MSGGGAVAVRHSYYEGPLPSADELARYAAVDPDAVRIILGQFDEQGRHRRALEAEVVRGTERRADRGQVLAAWLVLAGVASGVAIATAASAPVAGAGLASAAIGSGAFVFLVGGRPPRDDGAAR